MAANDRSDFSQRAAQFRALCQRCHGLDADIVYLQRKTQQLRASDCLSDLLALPETQARLATLRRQSARLATQRTQQEKNLAARIATLPQERLRAMLRYRYLELLPWAQICLLLELDDRWAFRLHRRALGLLAKDESSMAS